MPTTSAPVTVNVKVNGVAAAGVPVTAVSDDPTKVTVSPASANTDASGNATFTETAIKATLAAVAVRYTANGVQDSCATSVAVSGGGGGGTTPLGYTLFAADRADAPIGITRNASNRPQGTVYATPYNAPATVVTLTDQGSPTANWTALAAAIDAAVAAGGNRTIRLPAGVTYRGNKVLANAAAPIYIVSAALASLPAASDGTNPGTKAANRVDPVTHSAFMPIIENGAENLSSFQFAQGAGNYRFVGLRFGLAAGTTTLVSGWIAADYNFGAPAAVADYAHDVVVDRCVFMGPSLTDPSIHIRRAIYANITRFAAVDSYFKNIHDTNSDSQCILASSFDTAWKIDNCYLDAAGGAECVMIGGGSINVANLVPSDVEIRNNFFDHDLGYKGLLGVKNHFEIKIAQRVLVYGNVFRRMWHEAQDFSINIKTVHQDMSGTGNRKTTYSNNITIARNYLYAAAGVSISYNPEDTTTGGTTRLHIVDNVIIATEEYTVGETTLWRPLQTNGGAYVTVEHNTLIGRKYGEGLVLTGTGALSSLTNFLLRNNVLRGGEAVDNPTDPQPANWQINSMDGGGLGTAALNFHSPSWTMAGNTLSNVTNAALYPAGNRYVANEGLVGFVDPTNANWALRNYALAAGSPSKGTGQGGFDPGADVVGVILDAAAAGGTA